MPCCDGPWAIALCVVSTKAEGTNGLLSKCHPQLCASWRTFSITANPVRRNFNHPAKSEPEILGVEGCDEEIDRSAKLSFDLERLFRRTSREHREIGLFQDRTDRFKNLWFVLYEKNGWAGH
jgi:hypothetical protein